MLRILALSALFAAPLVSAQSPLSPGVPFLAPTAESPRALAPDGSGEPLGTFATADRPNGIIQLADGRVAVAVSLGIDLFTEEGALDASLSVSTRQAVVELADGRLLGADFFTVWVVDPVTETKTVFAGDYESVNDLDQLADGRILVTDLSGGRVEVFDTGGTSLGSFAPEATGPVAVMERPDGHVLVLDRGTAPHRLLEYEPDGTFVGTLATPGGDSSRGCLLDDGTIVIVDNRGSARRFSPTGTSLGLFAAKGTAAATTWAGCVQLSDGRVLINEFFPNERILAFADPTRDVPYVQLVTAPAAVGAGARFTARGFVANPTDAPLPIRVVLTVTDPNGASTVPNRRGRRAVIPAGGFIGEGPLGRYEVPPGAPAGTYTATLTMTDRSTDVVLSETSRTFTVSASSREASAAARVTTEVLGAHPNPFSGRTEIRFAVGAPGPVALRVFDVTGREVAALVDGPLDAGTHAATFEAGSLPAGTYVWRLEAGDAVESGRVTLVR